jgi:hypothetical protein
LVAAIAGEVRGDTVGEQRDLKTHLVDHATQRRDPGGIRRGQLQLIEHGGAGRAEHIGHRHDDSALGQHGVVWSLHEVRIPTSLWRYRTSSRNPQISGGAIQDSGNRPIRNRSARSPASRSSFVTRR